MKRPKATKIKAVEMVRKIRDRHNRLLAGKSTDEIIAFYHAAGQEALRRVGKIGTDLPKAS